MVLSEEESDKVQTPLYNTAILHDIIHCKHTEHVQRYIRDSENIRDGIALLNIWLHQRELDTVRFCSCITVDVLLQGFSHISISLRLYSCKLKSVLIDVKKEGVHPRFKYVWAYINLANIFKDHENSFYAHL